MQLLFDVYGIAGVMPHPHMEVSSTLPAPTAAVMATLSAAVFQQTIPWDMLLLGAMISLVFFCLHFFLRVRGISLSVLGIAMGVYLPLSSSMSLFLGGLLAWLVKGKKRSMHRDMILACGLIAGSAIMDVLLAIPFSLLQNPDAMNLAPAFWSPVSIVLSLMTVAGLYFWFRRLSE
jgi:uncharacterized oligopeptide transporter (OPT) family protein